MLSHIEGGAAILVFLMWLILFGGGILIDTKPYRVAISPQGVAALEGEPISTDAAPSAAPNAESGLVVAWIVVLLWFLPTNLAILCASAGILGAFGCRANLSDDRPEARSEDNSSPYISALLRGFFVYLFLISGLLLLDDAPFSSTSPGQYIRLAGFLSLVSFVVNYNPRAFSRLVVWASQRIQTRSGEDMSANDQSGVEITRATRVEMQTVQSTRTDGEFEDAVASEIKEAVASEIEDAVASKIEDGISSEIEGDVSSEIGDSGPAKKPRVG